MNADERARVLAFMRDDLRVLRHRLKARGIDTDDASAVAAVVRRLDFFMTELSEGNARGMGGS